MSEDKNEDVVDQDQRNEEVEISGGHTEEVLENRGLGETIVTPGEPDSNPEPEIKTINATDVKGAATLIDDLEVFGNGDLFQLLSKASSKSQGWMKSTKAMETAVGCVVQVTTQQKNPDGTYAVAEAVTFVPGVKIGTVGTPKTKVLVRL